jgi:DNA ligase-3
VQVHKEGQEFQYYSRNLKPVQPHKACNKRHPVLRPAVNGLVKNASVGLQVEHIKKYLPKVLPKGDRLILDGEVLLWDPKAQMPLPFGSLKYGPW